MGTIFGTGFVQLYTWSFPGPANFRCVRLSGNLQDRPLHVLVPRQQGSGTGCIAPSLGQSHVSVSSSSTSPKSAKTCKRAGDRSHSDLPSVADVSLVGLGNGDDGGATTPPPPLQGGSESCGRGSGSSLPGSSSGSTHFERSFNVSQAALNLEDADLEFLSNHLSAGTKTGYGYVFRKFSSFCSNLHTDPFSCTPTVLVKYIRYLYENGAQYRTVNHHRSSISKFHAGVAGVAIGSHPLVCQAVKAVFRLRPPLPRYVTTFDITKVFAYFQSLPTNEDLTLKQLSLKSLFLLTSACVSRVSSVSSLGPTVKVFKVSKIIFKL